MSEERPRTFSQDSLDLGEYHAGWLYEQVHRPAKKSVFTSFGFWLVLSIVLHAMAFAALAGVIFARYEAEQKAETIEVDTDMVELNREEAVTYRNVVNMEETTAEADAATLKESLTTGVDEVDVMGVDDMDISMNELDTLGEDTTRRRSIADLSGDMDLTRGVDTGGRDHKAAMNLVSRHVLEAARRGGATVVILFDESQSLLRERELMGKQLDRIFGELKFNMTDRQENATKWAVVSFSNRPRIQVDATRDVTQVQKALDKMPVDESGKENVCQAIQFCARKFGDESPHTMVLVVTDEQGDDIGLDEDASRNEEDNLRDTIELCREEDTRIYVLGREARLSTPRVQRHIANVGWGALERGLPTCRRETLKGRWYLGINHGEVPSGFGCYSLSLLADETRGQFLIIDTQPSPYDPDLMARLEPEWVLPETYEQANEDNDLRELIREIVEESNEDMPPRRRFCKEDYDDQIDEWDDEREKIDEKVRWCERAIDDLEKERGALREIDGDVRKRWAANRDLLRAQVYKLKAMLLQVDGELEDLMDEDEYPIEWPENRAFVITWSIRPTKEDEDADFHENREQRAALREARAALTNVADDYKGTPWGERARQELINFRPVEITLKIRRRHVQHQPRPKL